MIFKRKIEERIEVWLRSDGRKPLLLMGARQVGKTTLLKSVGAKNFDHVAYFNFEENTELKQFFEQTKDVDRLLKNLSLVHGRSIDARDTFIIFDEIQECRSALNALKYFCENAPHFAIAGAGSLLGITLGNQASFPVGKVDFLQLYPLTFEEYLLHADSKLYEVYLSYTQPQKIAPIPDLFFHQFVDLFKRYFISGGMPEPASILLEQQNIEKTQYILQNILHAYALDFSKHSEMKDVARIKYVWESIPSQLAKENKKFLYRAIKSGARAREYENALLWLEQAGLIIKVYKTSKPYMPLAAYDDLSSFKIYMLDVGLLSKKAQLNPQVFISGSRLFTEFKGALTENYIAQSLMAQFDTPLRYWTSSGKAEVDFLIQYLNQIIPVEVKSDVNVRSKSLAYYEKTHKPPLKIRFSLRNLEKNGNLINIPLFFADSTASLIKPFL